MVPPCVLVYSKIAYYNDGNGRRYGCIRPKIAKALNIHDYDKVEFRFDATGEIFHLKVKIMMNLRYDVLIHDFIHGHVQMAKIVRMASYGDVVTFESGRILVLPGQNMWVANKVIKEQGSVCLYFDGASKNNPRYPAGYGFHILEGREGKGEELVEAYLYAGMDRSNNEMEYKGLIEALIWATRLDLATLTICGDSELIINQLTGKYTIKNHRLKALHSKAHEILKKHSSLNVNFKNIPRQSNAIADNLANRAIATKKSAITVNWPNDNKLLYSEYG
jgi:ribonuclease HI